MTTFAENPAASLDFGIDWTTWLAGDVITSSSWTIDAGPTIINSGFTATDTALWVSGVSPDISYDAVNTIHTQGGRTEIGYLSILGKGKYSVIVTVEDGTNVTSANSYVSVNNARKFALNRGITLPDSNNQLAAMLMQAMDYIEARANYFQGVPTYSYPDYVTPQLLSWPRTGVSLNMQDLAPNVIPSQLIALQMYLVFAINNGVDLFPTRTADEFVTEETIGPITTKYANPLQVGLGDGSPLMAQVEQLFKILSLNASQNKFGFSTMRV